MNRNSTINLQRLPPLSAVVLALIAVCWTAPGETFDPSLAARDLPEDVLRHCVPSAVDTANSCVGREHVTSRWIGRTGRGDLFLVLRNQCAETENCQAWFVERTDQESMTLLKVNGEIRLYQGNGVYPTIQQRHDLSDTRITYSRFEWRGDKYVRTEQQIMYRVDGIECGTRSECARIAHEALRHDDADSAVKIYEDVHGVSWI
jgi:hypothetical protein